MWKCNTPLFCWTVTEWWCFASIASTFVPPCTCKTSLMCRNLLLHPAKYNQTLTPATVCAQHSWKQDSRVWWEQAAWPEVQSVSCALTPQHLHLHERTQGFIQQLKQTLVLPQVHQDGKVDCKHFAKCYIKACGLWGGLVLFHISVFPLLYTSNINNYHPFQLGVFSQPSTERGRRQIKQKTDNYTC